MKILKIISILIVLVLLSLGLNNVLASTGVINTKDATFRKDASTSAGVNGYFSKGDNVEIIEKSGEWYKIKYNNIEGFVYASLVDVETVITETEKKEENQQKVEEKPAEVVSNAEEQSSAITTTQTAITIAEITHIYSIPSVTAKTKSIISKGTEVSIEKTLNKWVYIKSGEIFGWVRKYYLEEHADAETPENNDDITNKDNTEKNKVNVEEPKANTEEPKSNNTVSSNDTEKTSSIAKGYISVSAANVRKETTTSSDIVTTLSQGTEVQITAETTDWYKVKYSSYEGYIKKTLISEKPVVTNRSNERTDGTTSIEEALDDMEQVSYEKKTGYVNVNLANVRKGASTNSEKYTTLKKKEAVTIIGEENDFYKIKIDSTEAYIAKKLISNSLADITETTVEATTKTTNTEVATGSTGSPTGTGIVDFATQYLGYSYVYGGTTPSVGFDCSGFVYYIYNSCGISLSRSCSVQASSGTAVSKADLQIGDLVFFDNTSDGSIGHVGIYIGNGMMIHAANPSRGVVKDTINSGYYNTYYYSARRVTE